MSQIAIDDQAWLPEPSDISQPVLASDLFQAILSLFITITQQVAQTKHSRRLRSEIERFFLWGGDFSVSDGQLDELLSKSFDLRQAVLSILYELGKVVRDDLLRVIAVTAQSEESDGFVKSALTDLAQSDGLASFSGS